MRVPDGKRCARSICKFAAFLLLFCRYIQMLKDDNSLRLKMGREGREAVGSRTIAYVVKDLLQWYATGSANRRTRSAVGQLVSVLMLSLSLPLTIFMIFWYDILVSCSLSLPCRWQSLNPVCR